MFLFELYKLVLGVTSFVGFLIRSSDLSFSTLALVSGDMVPPVNGVVASAITCIRDGPSSSIICLVVLMSLSCCNRIPFLNGA